MGIGRERDVEVELLLAAFAADGEGEAGDGLAAIGGPADALDGFEVSPVRVAFTSPLPAGSASWNRAMLGTRTMRPMV